VAVAPWRLLALSAPPEISLAIISLATEAYLLEFKAAWEVEAKELQVHKAPKILSEHKAQRERAHKELQVHKAQLESKALQELKVTQESKVPLELAHKALLVLKVCKVSVIDIKLPVAIR
jgi:hypothetical protein